MIDTDGNGSISLNELKERFQTQEQKNDSMWEEIFNEVDTNKDGKISVNEFIENMEKVIAKDAKERKKEYANDEKS